MNYQRILPIVLLLLVATVSVLLWSTRSATAQSRQQTTAEVKTHPSQGDVVEVDGASATLTTTGKGASVTLNTAQLEPGNVHTIWWVVVNQPEACATAPCTAKDILGNTEMVDAEITYGAGQVVDDSGTATFSANLAAGDVPNPWFGNGFNNPLGAEIHIVVNDHGPVIPEMVDNMLTTYRGGCTDESLPEAFPNTAKANGQPGPNTCRLVQSVIFQQLPAELPTTGGTQANAPLVWFLLLAAGAVIATGGWLMRRQTGGSNSAA